MNHKKASLILRRALDRQKRQNPSFSVRAIAKKMKVSHVFVLKLLKGESRIPPQRLKTVIAAFHLDELATAELKMALRPKESSISDFPPTETEIFATEMYHEYPRNYFTALDHWYELPLLELLTCTGPQPTSTHLARELGISENEVLKAIERLKEIGLIRMEEGIPKKAQRYIRFPTKIPQAAIQNYYLQILKRAAMELKKNQQSDFDRRLITNLCLAIDPKNLEKAKERLQKCLYEISLELTSGDTTQVYFLTTLLFPVSEVSNK